MGRLSNPPEQIETLVGGGVLDADRDRNGRSRPSRVVSRASESASSEEKGRLSNPRRLRVQRGLGSGKIDRLVAGYDAGQSLQDLAQIFGVHRRTVAAHLGKRGVPRRAQHRKLTEAEVIEAYHCYRAGASLAELGRLFDAHAKTMRRALVRAGATIRPRGTWAAH